MNEAVLAAPRKRRSWRRWAGAAGVVLAAIVIVVPSAIVAFTPIPWWMLLQGRSRINDHRHFDNAPIARAAVPSLLPAAPAALRFPGEPDAVAAEVDIARRGTVALLVARDGRLVYERYFDGYARDSLVTSFSIAKSVVSLLVGIAIDEGRITSVDEPVTRGWPELAQRDRRFEHITLRHLLSMRSGIAFDEGYRSPFSDAADFYLTRDLALEVAALRIREQPNQTYAYKSGDTQLLAMVLERAVGMPIARYAQIKLWQPLGAEFDASWSLDSAANGQAKGFCCLNARAVDFVRLGLMVANRGEWNGKRIVSAEWLRASTAAQLGLPGTADPNRRNLERPYAPGSAFYAWQWRLRPLPGDPPRQPGTMVYAQGLHGQILLIDPETRTVVLRLGKHQGERHWPTWMEALLRLNR